MGDNINTINTTWKFIVTICAFILAEGPVTDT